MLRVTSQRLDIHPRPEDYPDQVDLRDMEKDFPLYPELGMPSPTNDMSAIMTLNPGPDQKLTVEELQQQVDRMSATLTIIQQQLQQLMGN